MHLSGPQSELDFVVGSVDLMVLAERARRKAKELANGRKPPIWSGPRTAPQALQAGQWQYPRASQFLTVCLKGIYFLVLSFHSKHFLKLICLWWKHRASFHFPSSLFYKTPSTVQTHASFHPESYYDALSIESQLLRHQIKG